MKEALFEITQPHNGTHTINSIWSLPVCLYFIHFITTWHKCCLMLKP